MPRFSMCLLLLTVTVLLSAVSLIGVAQAPEPVVHVVQPGENLYRISLRYGLTMEQVAAANNISDYTRVYVGQRLTIPGLSAPVTSEEVENPLVASAPVMHSVQYGETLNTIARTYGVTIAQILEANSIPNPNLIKPGQTLNIWSATSAEQAIIAAEVGEQVVTQLDIAPETQPQTTPNHVHVVVRGETLARIAQRYNVAMNQIMVANGIVNPDRVLVGQRLTIPGVAAESTNIAQDLLAEHPPITPPAPSITTGKLIMVDLSDSMTYAFQDGQLVYQALSSMGLPATPTVTGQYSVYYRLPSQTMSGPGYYLPGVQWVQYFYQGYALHGAYWHDNFGQPMSHGCVNLTNQDAQWFYEFGEIGTPVHVQY